MSPSGDFVIFIIFTHNSDLTLLITDVIIECHIYYVNF